MAELKIQEPFPQQIEFFMAQAKYIAYGGARGGGKSWAARTKAVLLALGYKGIQILLLRRTFPELRENHINPLRSMLKGIATYKETEKAFVFPNGSRIKLGYCAAEADVLQYQGQAYEIIFMEEATQFTEFQFAALTETNRLSSEYQAANIGGDLIKPRMYFTCNPGGCGHTWVKRLFIDRDYRQSERPEDYVFIASKVYDNKFIMENDPDYVRTLENLPEDRRKAMLDGDWDIFEGQYFGEFNREIHTIEPFKIPNDWSRSFVMDYGLDMLAGYWVAMDELGRAYVYREVYKSGLIITDAIKTIKEMTPGDETISQWIAPPDMWNRRQDTGKSVADIFGEHGIYLTKASNNRVQGWYNLKEWLQVKTDEYGKKTAALRIFKNCNNLIRCLPAVQYDTKDPNDVAREPHELTHSVDAIRYWCAGRQMPALKNIERKLAILPFALRTDDVDREDVFMEW
jgi:phage terminase large subunit